MDYMKEGSLANLLDLEIKSLCPQNYDNTKRQIILVGIARGMMLLHKRFIIHRDLKPENILLDSGFHPRITDFGLSKFFDPYHSTKQSISDSGTAIYMAPEVIISDHFNTKADVYAFGILMYEIIGGKRAYDNLLHGKNRLTLYQLKQKVEKGFRPKIDFPIKKGLQQIIEKCWSEDPKERPTFNEIFKKLSLSNEDYFLEFEDNYEEPKIILEDGDEDEESDLNKTYCLDDVDIDELLYYIDEIKEEIKETQSSTSKENEEIKLEMEKMKKIIQEQENQISTLKKEKDDQMKNMITIIKEQATKISLLETKISGSSTVAKDSPVDEIIKTIQSHTLQINSLQQSFTRFFTVKMSKEGPGILSQLKEKQKKSF